METARSRMVLGTLRRFRLAALCGRGARLPAPERRFIAFPEAQEAHRSGSNWQVGSGLAMSALGQKQTLGKVRLMSALPPKADIGTQPRNVRFVPKADIMHHSK